MAEQEYFKKALGDFTFEFAGGNAVRKLARQDYSIEEIAKKLDYPIYGHDHTNEYNALIIRPAFGNAWQHWDGGNRKAANLSGIDTKRIMFVAYLNMAILTVVTAWVVMAKFQAANSTAGTNFEMDAISACVVGGVSAYGGSGSVFGMIIGATLIGVINLGMSLMGVDANWQKVVKGVVLLGAVVFDILNTKDKSER